MGNSRDEKRRRCNVPSVFHGSVATARLEEKALPMSPDRPLALRGRQTRDQMNKRVITPKVTDQCPKEGTEGVHHSDDLYGVTCSFSCSPEYLSLMSGLGQPTQNKILVLMRAPERDLSEVGLKEDRMWVGGQRDRKVFRPLS
ncbi:hypothetical protein TNCV_2339721 [Trichonephila clavipes]|nr:hypothetical protein TNCV_2339721 [Trichonephila clavipes]